MHTGKIRTIVRDPEFEHEMAQLQSSVQRADEFLEGAETILSREPESRCRMEDGSNVWFVSGHTLDIAIYYTFDADHVYFLSARRVKMPEL